MNKYKKYILFLGILVILSPIGIYLPEIFNAGDAWGEWNVESVKEQTGSEPAGMKKDAELFSAPVPDYNLGKEDDPLPVLSANYIISALIGTGIIIIITFGTLKLMSRKQNK